MAKKLTKAQIVEWLNTQIKAKEMQAQTIDDGEIIFNNFSESDYIHINSKAVRYASELLGLKLNHRDREYDGEYPHEIYFMFDNVKVMAIESDELYEDRGAVE